MSSYRVTIEVEADDRWQALELIKDLPSNFSPVNFPGWLKGLDVVKFDRQLWVSNLPR